MANVKGAGRNQVEDRPNLVEQLLVLSLRAGRFGGIFLFNIEGGLSNNQENFVQIAEKSESTKSLLI